MSKVTKKRFLYVLGVLALIAFAMWLRYASRQIFHSPAVNHLRSGIYVFLFSAWCYSIWMRIVQTQVRRYLLAISVLMVLWILLRSIKFSIDNTDAGRWLWYFYYLPMLLIPMLSVFVSRSLGKGEDFQLPRWTKLLYFPTLLLLLLVLTNDLHQQVFSFPSGVLSDQEYRYEGGYFFVLGWVALCAGFALLSMVKNCRIPRSRRIRWLPLVPLALSLVYACMYIKKVYWVWVLAGDMTVSQCLIFASIFECCIQCGLIQSNLGYDELFEATSLPVQITDPAFCPKYASVSMQEALPQSELQQIPQDTVHLSDDTLLKRHKLRRGWVFWKEDVSALNQVQKELELTRDELRDTGDVLAAENAQRARWLKLTEENRLYDMMEAQTARQIAMLRDLLAELQKAEDPDRARRLLGQVIIIGTYIKRRSNLTFVGVQRGAISVQELRLCLNESSENISIYGADCKTIIKGEGRLTVEQATQVYDLFEAVVEAELESLRALLISIEVGKWVEIALCVSGAEPLCGLRTRFPDLEWEQDEDGLQYVTRKLEKIERGIGAWTELKKASTVCPLRPASSIKTAWCGSSTAGCLPLQTGCKKAVYSRWQRCKALCRRRRQACAVWMRAFGFTVFRTEQRCALHRSRSQQKRASDIRKSLPQTLRS